MGISSYLVSGHFWLLHRLDGKCLRRCALWQQLRHDHKPLIAAVGLVVLPAASGKGQDGIFLGEGHAVKIQPVFPLHGLEEEREQRSFGARCPSAALSDVRLWGHASGFDV